MENGWPTARDDADGGATAEVVAEPIDAVATTPFGGAEGEVDERTDVAGDGTPGSAEAPEGEEEDHRSAVDAVDELLDEVERSLARLDDGTYGRCDTCGSAIDDGRLAESPIVRTCGSCVIGGGTVLTSVGGGSADPMGTTDPVTP